MLNFRQGNTHCMVVFLPPFCRPRKLSYLLDIVSLSLSKKMYDLSSKKYYFTRQHKNKFNELIERILIY